MAHGADRMDGSLFRSIRFRMGHDLAHTVVRHGLCGMGFGPGILDVDHHHRRSDRCLPCAGGGWWDWPLYKPRRLSSAGSSSSTSFRRYQSDIYHLRGRWNLAMLKQMAHASAALLASHARRCF